jgi:hypothetical protein
MNDNYPKQTKKEKAVVIRRLFKMKKIPFESYSHLLKRTRKRQNIQEPK